MNRKSAALFVIDILLVTAAFLVFIWIKPASLRVYLPAYIKQFVVFLVIWLGFSLLMGKYRYSAKNTLRDFVVPVIDSSILSAFVVLTLIYFYRRLGYSRLIVFGTITASAVFELMLFTLFYYYRKLNRDTDRLESIEKFMAQAQEPPEVEGKLSLQKLSPAKDLPTFSLSRFRSQIMDEAGEEPFGFMCRHIDPDHNSTLVISTSSAFNLDVVPGHSFNIIVNLRLVNDIRRVNKFFEAVNSHLPQGGLFIGCVETNEIRKRRILSSYPPVVKHVAYAIHYLFWRVTPKIPYLKRLYFFMTNGFDRSISEAEAYGRLYSCGFELIDTMQSGGRLYFTVRKIKEPFFDLNPTYGPLISLKRIGKNGKIIYVYKLRTMHPFAEYLQEYVHANNDLEEGGKFRNDFRISTLGRLCRKFWLDELPMLFNFLKGDLKLVGVRPISRHYFSLYTKELQERRIRYKPGLVPPFYADLPKTLDEIMASELKYLESYEKKPFRTDWQYFWKAIYNILFKHARSK